MEMKLVKRFQCKLILHLQKKLNAGAGVTKYKCSFFKCVEQ